MTSEELYQAIGNIDGRFVDDRPIDEIKRKTPVSLLIKWASVAACVALVAAGVLTVLMRPQLPADIVYPEENAPTNTVFSLSSWNTTTYLTYADLANKSKAVVVADVLDTFTAVDRHSPNQLMSYATVQVAEVIKGDVKKGDSIIVQDNGYMCVDEAGDTTAVYSNSGGPLMETGNRVLLFLNTPPSSASCLTESGQPYYTLTQWSIGVFFYDKDGRYHAAACYDEYIDGKAWMLYDYEPKTLKEIKQNIRQ